MANKTNKLQQSIAKAKKHSQAQCIHKCQALTEIMNVHWLSYYPSVIILITQLQLAVLQMQFTSTALQYT